MKTYLANYKASFGKDIDDMWDAHDLDGNGYLDRAEARTFVFEISQCIERERAKNYNPLNFDQLFDRFDENKDHFLSKSEMAVFIKKVFNKTEKRNLKDQPNP